MLAARFELELLVERFQSATCPEDIFGNLPGSATEQLTTLKLKARLLTKSCHPDLALAVDKLLATQVFQWLGKWEETARQKIEVGTYGDFEPHRSTSSVYVPVSLDVKGKQLTLTNLIAEGSFASVHDALYEGERNGAVFVKCARSVYDNDLLEREFVVLKHFQLPDAHPQTEAFFEKQRAYVPAPVASFFTLDEDKAKHRANVLKVPRDNCYTAKTLREEKFPGGIEPRHVWWIFRRLLLTAWMAHLKGYVHGGITPDHVLVYPEAHGLVLLDWTCAARIDDEHIPALNPDFEEFYPPEVRSKEPARPSIDIYMAAATAIYMLGGNPAKRHIPASVAPHLSDLLLSCLHPIPRRRPQDAERLHNEFGDLLGRRVYSHMVIP